MVYSVGDSNEERVQEGIWRHGGRLGVTGFPYICYVMVIQESSGPRGGYCDPGIYVMKNHLA